jgi:uncharacterized protein (DUF433 family)
MMTAPNLLETGIYTVAEAAYLVRASKQKVRGWVQGYPKTQRAPIIDNELGWIGNRVAFSFTNLMEIRFIAFFERAGVHFWHIRAIMEQVKKELSLPHPFATSVVFRTDGRKIVSEIVAHHGVEHIFDLRTKNYEMRTVVLGTLKDDVIYDPVGMARAWYPRLHIAPNVLVHPRFAFGRPILKQSRIPTRTISDAVQAEGGIRAVARWYEIPEKQVREAVNFETNLRKAA